MAYNHPDACYADEMLQTLDLYFTEYTQNEVRKNLCLTYSVLFLAANGFEITGEMRDYLVQAGQTLNAVTGTDFFRLYK